MLIDYENVTIERAGRLVLKNVTFHIDEGEFCYLTGSVGSGKSSLLKTMYGEVEIPDGDKAEVLGFDVMGLRHRQIPQLRRRMGIVFQDFQLLQDRSASENLRFVLRATGWKNKGEINDRVEEVLKAVGMENKAYKMPHSLSGGEQQRVVIARALLNNPKLILADEPTGNLDPATGEHIMADLHSIAAEGNATVVVATHNHGFIRQFPGRVLRCERKMLLE